jgi:threonine dehydrogenase-like Zn-dependent dehydrogenase
MKVQAVLGTGSVGLCVIQAAYNMGAHPLIVVDLNDEKIEFAKHFGASIKDVWISSPSADGPSQEASGGGTTTCS